MKMITFVMFSETALNQRQDEIYPCVITVPFYFTVKQRELVLGCAKEAGFHVLRVINEPTAAALAYVHKAEASTTSK